MKNNLPLHKVVLLGRTFEEYARYFEFSIDDLKNKKILDIAAGVSSFCAEAHELGLTVTAFDLIYDRQPEQIQRQCELDLNFVVREISDVKAYRWDFYKNAEGMGQFRERAYKRFLRDYQNNKSARYFSGKLPQTPFAENQFDLTLVSYFLFVYEDQFDYAFHKESILEIMRVTNGEAWIYPLVNFKAERCSYLEKLKQDSDLRDFKFEEIATNFEFLRNSNSYLKIRRIIPRAIKDSRKRLEPSR